MKCKSRASGSLAMLVAVAATGIAAAENHGLDDAIMSGKAGVTLRARYEHVDQDSFTENADALTARLRLNYRSGEWRAWQGFVEFDYVLHALRDFNSGAGTSPDKTQYPVVADPKGADLNQLYADYRFSDATSLRLGRQRILLDNQRFVGGVGWRQNEQTYDGITLSTKAIEKTSLSYSYVGMVRRIFGEEVVAGRNDVDAHLLNAKIVINDAWSVTPYFYYIDNDDFAAFSTATAGVRVLANVKIGEGKASLAAEAATQKDAANNPANYDAQYWHLNALWSPTSELSLGIAYESLGADTGAAQSFRTPLATLHAFQGWADQFLATPSNGVNDLYATAKYRAGQWNLTAVYHDFSSDTGSVDFGTEIDLAVARPLSERYSLLFKGAFFSGDAASFPDTNKFWVMFTANY